MKIIASYKGTDPSDIRSTVYTNVSAFTEAPNGFIISYKDGTKEFLHNAICDDEIVIDREDS